MKLVIDLQGAQNDSRWRGIGRYSLALANAIVRNRGSHEVIIALNAAFPETIRPIRNAFLDWLPQENIRVWSAPGPTHSFDPANFNRRKRAMVIYESFLASLEPDVILVSSLFEGYGESTVATVNSMDFGIPTAVTLFDLIPLHDENGFLDLQKTIDSHLSERLDAMSRADLLLAISDFTARDARNYFGNELKEITNISSACSDIFKPSTMSQSARADLLKRSNIDRKYIITSGSAEPRKNLATLIRAFSKLPASVRCAYQIAVVGKVLPDHEITLNKWAQSAGLHSNELVITGYISDEELVALYSDAALMVFPSFDEGFGLPPLEAMACGTPTLASRSASLPEVIGLDEAMFDPFDEDQLSQLIKRALNDDPFYAKLRKNALFQSSKFSWDTTGKRALRAMENLLKKKNTSTSNEINVLERCLDVLASIDTHPNEMPLLAQSLAQNFPDSNQPRQLFVDITNLQESDPNLGTQPAIRAILMKWLENPPPGVSIEPVYATPDKLGYRYANAFVAQLMGTKPEASNAVIDFQPGDIFVGLAHHPMVVSHQKPWLDHMNVRGVHTWFAIEDISLLEWVSFVPKLELKCYESFLKTISGFDGVIATSQDAANSFKSWQIGNAVNVSPDFQICSANLDANILDSLLD